MPKIANSNPFAIISCNTGHETVFQILWEFLKWTFTNPKLWQAQLVVDNQR
jgi:hypothetical protein